jgi:tetratricopeptide (TPR) repeat protein
MQQATAIPELIGKRYRLLDSLGQGGMGTVYRALDRFTGDTVALKRVTVAGDSLEFASRPSRGDSSDYRLALAQEFKTLASLRHPNIIGVLDYGFDGSSNAQRQPYFTMMLLENAETLTAYGRRQPLETRVDLLIQTLQALAYLHRRDVLHRDMKPDNVLVVDGQVKVLDFGLAVAQAQTQDNSESTAGTLAYIAPEVLVGDAVTSAADLYAVGVMAYELLAGRHPFATGNPNQLIAEILSTAPNFSTPEFRELDTQLVEVVQKLLGKSPDSRYKEAYAVIRDLREALELPMLVESTAIRESFLQAAEFVGREAELKLLEDGLAHAMDGQGSAWLVAGESGVGKSRLLDELRTRALVSGVPVLRGQGVAEAGVSYELWHDSLRRLVLTTDIKTEEASILKDIVPDIAVLLERPVPDALMLEGSAYRQRLLMTITALFQRQREPLLLILEDLQWAEESLDVLKALNAVAPQLPLMIVGNYRIDERPNLPNELPGMRVIRLERLDETSIARLSESMLGVEGSQPDIVHFLQRETEGNVFFLVEVVRALAEEAGQLERIGYMTLPARVLAGGVQRIVQRRLSRLTEDERTALRMAAVLGRQLDLRLLQNYSGKNNLEPILVACANAMILDVQDNQWRFAHDKLREGLLADFTDEERRERHRAAAELILHVYGDDPKQASSLAYHWGIAGDTAKELIYATHAADEAFRMNVPQTAVEHYSRALQIARNSETISREQLIHLYSRLGRTLELNTHYQQALDLYTEFETVAKQRNDRSMLLSAVLAHAVILSVPSAVLDLEAGERIAKEALALSRELGDRAAEAKALWCLLLTNFYGGSILSAIEYGEQSLVIARELNLREQIAYTLNNLALAYLSDNIYKAIPILSEVETLWREQNNLSMLTDVLGMGVFAHYFHGTLDKAITSSNEAFRLSESIGNLWGQSFALMMVGAIYAQRGEIDKGLETMELCLRLSEQAGHMAPLVETRVIMAEVYAELGMLNQALEAVELAYQAAERYMRVQIMLPLIDKAWIYFLKEDYEQAEEIHAQFNALLIEDQPNMTLMFSHQVRMRLDVGFAWHEGDYDSALDIIQKAEKLTTDVGVMVALADILYYKGVTLVKLNRLVEAYEVFQTARVEAERCDLRVNLLFILSAQRDMAEQDGQHEVVSTLNQDLYKVASYILDHTQRPDVRASFLNMPVVREIFK